METLVLVVEFGLAPRPEVLDAILGSALKFAGSLRDGSPWFSGVSAVCKELNVDRDSELMRKLRSHDGSVERDRGVGGGASERGLESSGAGGQTRELGETVGGDVGAGAGGVSVGRSHGREDGVDDRRGGDSVGAVGLGGGEAGGGACGVERAGTGEEELHTVLERCSLSEIVGLLGRMGEFEVRHLTKAMTRMAALLRQSSQRMEDQDVLFLQAVFNRAAQIPYQFDAGVFCEFLLSAGELGVVPASTSLSAIVRRARELIDTSTDTQVATIIRTCSGWQNVALAEADGVTNVLSYWKVVPSPDLMRALRGDQGQETAEGRGHQGVAQGRWESPRRDGGDAGRGAGGVKGRDGSEGEARSPGVSSLEKRALGASRSAELRGLISKCSTEREVHPKP